MAPGAESAPADSPPPIYAITDGGPLRWLSRKLRLTRDRDRRGDWLRRTGLFLLVGYAPLLLIGVGFRVVAGDWLPALQRIDTHVRALVTVPLLLFAEPLVDDRARAAGRYLFASEMAGGAAAACRAAVARSASLRDSWLIECGLFLVALATIVFDPARYLGAPAVALSAFGSLPMLVLLRFLLLRWLWRWLLWTLYVSRVVRSPIALHSTHPDRLAGLGPFWGPSGAFWVVAAAMGSSLAGAWAELMVRSGVTLTALRTPALAYFVIVVLLALLPALVMLPRLYRMRWAGLIGYGGFAHRFTGAFEARWFGASGAEGLGTPDISSLNDLGGSYQVVDEIRVLSWVRRIVLAVLGGALLPLVPLVLLEFGFTELLVTLVRDVV